MNLTERLLKEALKRNPGEKNPYYEMGRQASKECAENIFSEYGLPGKAPADIISHAQDIINEKAKKAMIEFSTGFLFGLQELVQQQISQGMEFASGIWLLKQHPAHRFLEALDNLDVQRMIELYGQYKETITAEYPDAEELINLLKSE